MKFSIIVPVYNSHDTLRDCLDSISSSEIKDFEVIVVNAKSTDASAEIAKRYTCKLITLDEKKKASGSRNIGSDNARGEIFVFVDADVAIKKNTLSLIDKNFKEDKDIAAITGVLSKETPHKNFFTQYKNLYMHYIFKRCPRYVDFLYGSLIAIRRDYFLRFDESFKITDDTELGQRYKKLNKKILLNPELEVVHFKKYDFKGIIKNGFFVPFWWAKSFMLHNGYKDIFRKKRFSHARVDQMTSIVISYLLILSLFFWDKAGAITVSSILLITFFLLNYKFFAFLHKERGFFFSIKATLFTYLDMLIMGLGILTGFIYFNLFDRR